MAPQPQIKLEGISKSFAGVHALRSIDLQLNRGEVCCLAGENGCGKSTLIKIISGVYAPDGGLITIDGKPYRRLTPADAIGHGIEVIYQDFSVFPNLTVAENISLNAQIMAGQRLVSWKQVRARARTAMERIGVRLELDRPVEELTVADRQLVAISRALTHDARMIIMDEPTSALTQREVRALLEVIRELKKDNISILFVSHKLDEVMEVCDRVVVLRNGQTVSEGAMADYDQETIIRHMTGRAIETGRNTHRPERSQPPLLQVEALTQRGGFREVSFRLDRGEILGVTGLLGSGRTALANALFGVRPVQAGRVLLKGKPVRLRSVRDAMEAGIGYVPEDRLTEGLFLEQPIDRNMAVTVPDRMRGRCGLIHREKIARAARHWTGALNIRAASGQAPAKLLSGGNQQKVVIAKWLATRPKVLILNGPTVGVDIGAKTDILELIRSLAREGMGIILVSDDLSELLAACNRVLVMRAGRIVEELRDEAMSEAALSALIRGEPAGEEGSA